MDILHKNIILSLKILANATPLNLLNKIPLHAYSVFLPLLVQSSIPFLVTDLPLKLTRKGSQCQRYFKMQPGPNERALLLAVKKSGLNFLWFKCEMQKNFTRSI
jgi:hypothetical protein